MSEQPAHSIKRHPLQELMTEEEFARLANDVQFCRVSWPICVDRRSQPPAEPEQPSK